ncbi:MAG: 2-oxo acid dehydrogenase subunit E2, partial [Spirochaetaceae bacterium]|nr:2-oxo acid dehydrogenase subunit E2 [Spirochaetaceae bacterium]
MERVVVPKVDLQSQKVEIMIIHKFVGDRVVRDEVLLEVTTDKATIDVVSPCDGIVAAVYGAVGDEIAVGAHVAEIATSEEETRMLAESPAEARLSETGEEPTGETKTSDAPPTPSVVHRMQSSPTARRLCRDHGVTVEEVFAWTKHEPVNEADVGAYVAKKGGADRTSLESVPDVRRGDIHSNDTDGYILEKVSTLRRTIARRMVESVVTKPHIYLVDEFNVSKLVAVTQSRQRSDERAAPKFADIVFYAIVRSVAQDQGLNCHVVEINGDLEIRQFNKVNLGIAVATEHGLMVPVVHDANHLSLQEFGSKKLDLVGRARGRKLSLAEVTGSTITATNLGSLGVPLFMPIINPPEA